MNCSNEITNPTYAATQKGGRKCFTDLSHFYPTFPIRRPDDPTTKSIELEPKASIDRSPINKLPQINSSIVIKARTRGFLNVANRKQINHTAARIDSLFPLLFSSSGKTHRSPGEQPRRMQTRIRLASPRQLDSPLPFR